MNDKKDEALKLALEALEDAKKNHGLVYVTELCAIREALVEQPAPGSHLTDEQKAANGLAWLARLEALREEWAGLAEQPAQQQEPLCTAAMFDEAFLAKSGLSPDTLLYTRPPASKPWVGLTDEEIQKEFHPLHATGLQFARAIEAKLKAKNS